MQTSRKLIPLPRPTSGLPSADRRAEPKKAARRRELAQRKAARLQKFTI